MMINRENLMEMAKVRGAWCVSFYLPINQDNFRANRNLLRKLMFDAEKKLIDLRVSLLTIAKLLLPIEQILDDNQFWNGKKNGLAIFLSPSSCKWHTLTKRPAEMAVVSNRFYLKPLYSLVTTQVNKNILRIIRKQKPNFRTVNLSMIPPKMLTSNATA